MYTLAPFCLLGILIGIGMVGKPFVDRAVTILSGKRKEMYDEAKRIRKLIDNEMDAASLIEAWYLIHDFYKIYRFVPRCKAVTGGLHSYRLNRLSEIQPTIKYLSKESILAEIPILMPMQSQSN